MNTTILIVTATIIVIMFFVAIISLLIEARSEVKFIKTRLTELEDMMIDSAYPKITMPNRLNGIAKLLADIKRRMK